MIYFNSDNFIIYNSDCLSVLSLIDDNSVDSIVTDPPYGISFMNKKWDYDIPDIKIWQECLRVLKPGGYLFSACGTRTQHRMATRIEDAGFEIRDIISWLFAGKFAKSIPLDKAIDDFYGAEREVIGFDKKKYRPYNNMGGEKSDGWERPWMDDASKLEKRAAITLPSTDDAKKFQGWGTGIKSSMELFTLCRKPISEKTIVENIIKWGTGGLNIDGCKIKGERHPANVIYEGGDESDWRLPDNIDNYFYCSKPSPKEKNYGMSDSKNTHPTVKPIDLMRYLCRLITPVNGTVLDPFMGSGTTGISSVLENFNFIGIDVDKTYCEIAEQRIKHARKEILTFGK